MKFETVQGERDDSPGAAGAAAERSGAAGAAALQSHAAVDLDDWEVTVPAILGEGGTSCSSSATP